MAKVNFEIAGEELQRKEKAAVFSAKNSSGQKIGELWVSQGGIRWYPARARKNSSKPRLIPWKKLTATLDSEV